RTAGRPPLDARQRASRRHRLPVAIASILPVGTAKAVTLLQFPANSRIRPGLLRGRPADIGAAGKQVVGATRGPPRQVRALPHFVQRQLDSSTRLWRLLSWGGLRLLFLVLTLPDHHSTLPPPKFRRSSLCLLRLWACKAVPRIRRVSVLPLAGAAPTAHAAAPRWPAQAPANRKSD